MQELERQLWGRMMDVIGICQRELHWKPILAVQMINKHGAAEAARIMVLTPNGTDGYTKCWLEGRLELSFEHIILEPEFSPLFTEDVLQVARDRLEQARLKPPPPRRT